MKNLFGILAVTVLIINLSPGCKGQGSDNCFWASSPDAVTGASASYYRTKFMLKDDELYSVLRNPIEKQIFFAVATVRCDGTPNIATVMPYAVSKDVIAIVLAPDATTRKNILATGNARAILRYTDKKAVEGFDIFGNVGSRIWLQLLNDKNECEKFYKENEEMLKRMMAKSVDDIIFLKIKEVYPLG